MKPAISVHHLTKRYLIGRREAPYRTLRESLMATLAAPARFARARLNGRSNGSPDVHDDEILALNNLSFDIDHGEVVGIIGRNGAGKSTLLKVFSRITEPTSGHVELRGRVGSLLEVGTGFHPELTGRENIFLNGAILGMSRREVLANFDNIVDFAEIGSFLDTPVKRYSSGMHMRLAFAVAAHLQPEILVVDEVLAVGDSAFQKKCLGKMSEVSRAGRTVLFVSHNMSAVKSLCSRAILLKSGRVEIDGPVDEVVDYYLGTRGEHSRTGLIPEDAPRIRDVRGVASMRSVQMTDLDGNEISQLYFRQPFCVSFVCELYEAVREGHFEISICTLDDTHVTYTTTMGELDRARVLAPGLHEIKVILDPVLLPREYTIDLGVHRDDGTTLDYVQGVLRFSVLRVAGTQLGHYPWERTRGMIEIQARWEFNQPCL